MPDIDTLIREGKYGEAAAILAASDERAHLERAISLYERLWNFREAAKIARKLGDRVRALRLSLEGKDLPGAAELAAEIPQWTQAERRAASDVYAARRMYAEAAALEEQLGERGRAAELYEKAGMLLEQARLYEILGHMREAGAVYERALSAGGMGGADDSRAHLALG